MYIYIYIVFDENHTDPKSTLKPSKLYIYIYNSNKHQVSDELYIYIYNNKHVPKQSEIGSEGLFRAVEQLYIYIYIYT